MNINEILNARFFFIDNIKTNIPNVYITFQGLINKQNHNAKVKLRRNNCQGVYRVKHNLHSNNHS